MQQYRISITKDWRGIARDEIEGELARVVALALQNRCLITSGVEPAEQETPETIVDYEGKLFFPGVFVQERSQRRYTVQFVRFAPGDTLQAFEPLFDLLNSSTQCNMIIAWRQREEPQQELLVLVNSPD